MEKRRMRTDTILRRCVPLAPTFLSACKRASFSASNESDMAA